MFLKCFVMLAASHLERHYKKEPDMFQSNKQYIYYTVFLFVYRVNKGAGEE